MRPNTLRRLHRAGAPIVNAWLSIPSAYAAEVVASQDFDAATVDMQHGMMGFAEAVGMLQAISTTRAIPLVRPPGLDGPAIMRLLDAGAYGVICPMISTRAEAEALVAACRYPPAGRRSFGPSRGLLYGGADYFSHANAEILVLAMIETREALANLDEILATSGLDGVYVGPNDLAIELGHAPKAEHDHPEVVAAIARICAATNDRGLLAGIFCSDGAAARQRRREGFGLVTPGNDAATLKAALAAAVAISRS
jgi:4-hydroxy-2-oxoheptanedioate aldolase